MHDSLITVVVEPAFVSTDPSILVQLLVFGLLLGSIYALVALGLTMIFGVMNILNLAHGALMVVGMYTVWTTSAVLGLPAVLGIPLAVLTVSLVGAIIYVTSLAPFAGEAEAAENHLIVTIGWLLILVAGMQLLFSPASRSLDVDAGSIGFAGVYIPVARLGGLIVAVIAVLVLIGFLRRTRLGRTIRATADNRESAKYVGIDVHRIDTITFAIGAGLAGLAGAIIPFLQRFDPYLGDFYLVTAFIVVVLGGLGSFKGALVGGLIVGLIEVFGSFYLPGSTYRVLVFGLFIVVLLVKPSGLFGGGSRG